MTNILSTISSFVKDPKRLINFAKSINENRNRKEFFLEFEQDPDNRWYIVCPEYPGPRANLEMVCGADDLLTNIRNNSESNKVYVEVHPSKAEDTDYILTKTQTGYGATYDVTNQNNSGPSTLWLCPVTLFVMGQYPENISIKVMKKEEFDQKKIA